MTNYSYIYKRIEAGKYESKVPYPERPRTPEQMTEYRTGVQEANDKFRHDLEKQYGVIGNTKANRVWELAWEEGHSFGYTEVLGYYDQFVELIK